MPHNIEKSAFHKGEYVGYGAGKVWRIIRNAEGWIARAQDWSRPPVTGRTLEQVSSVLDMLAA